ncbi:endonuclease/exonuclease/phosphatase family protein [Kitasatospora sp. NPDC127067]|uniref:endonuclease/exonuclease/phosphatase family protein n=1 Tax=Kitasatospora sp. NPDC127067 TaxID=3347126 RepID=UPI003656BA2D
MVLHKEVGAPCVALTVRSPPTWASFWRGAGWHRRSRRASCSADWKRAQFHQSPHERNATYPECTMAEDARLSLFSRDPYPPGQTILAFYEVAKPGDNRVGLYREGEENPVRFTTFRYAPGRAGVVRFPGTSTGKKALPPGQYTLRLIRYEAAENPADDKAEVLCDPVAFRIADRPYFLADSVTEAPVVAGQDVAFSLAGIVECDEAREVEFVKLSGDDWLQVSAEGDVTGAAPGGAGAADGLVVVAARYKGSGGQGSGASAAVRVPVYAPGTAPTDHLRVATMNLWVDLAWSHNGISKVLRTLLEHDVDIAGFQEVKADRAPTVKTLAARLGWEYRQLGDVGLVSRYPIQPAVTDPELTGPLRVKVAVGDLTVQFVALHLDYTFYGPDKAPPGRRVFTDDVRKEETASRRTAEIKDVLKALSDDLKGTDTSPIVALGDFNCPSHRDWTSNTAPDPRNWPVTQLLEDARFTDSYRALHPDPVSHPGITWSPNTFWRPELASTEPQDRIDFIFHRGRRLRPIDSRPVAPGTQDPGAKHPAWERSPGEDQYMYNEWPSDHAAVITTYQILPS